MAGIFPNSGVIASSATNAQLVPSGNLSAGCTALYASTSRCAPRFDPAAFNAIVSELVNVTICAGLAYNCNRLDNLCTAIKQLISDGLYRCQTGNFDAAGAACSIEPLAMQTDSAGCRKIVRLNRDALPSVIGRNNSVWGTAYGPAMHPLTPANPATYYNLTDLRTDIIANTLNPAKLTPNHLLSVNVTVPCQAQYELEYTQQVFFSPAANGGNGTLSAVVVRVDGAFLTFSDGSLLFISSITNFVTQITDRLVTSLAPGAHVIDLFIVARTAGTPPTQIVVQGAPVASGGFLTVRIKSS